MRTITVSDATLLTIQSKGRTLTFREKLAVSEKLNLVKVNAIELPAIGILKENEVVCSTICSAVKNSAVKIVVYNEEDVVKALNCANGVKDCCLQVALPVSTAQMEYFYHVKAPAMLELILNTIKICKKYTNNVEFVALDAFRAEHDFLIDCVKNAYNLGVCNVVISDDAGFAFPEDYSKIIKEIKTACNVNVLIKPSNSLKMAVACAIEGIKAGADGIVTSFFGNYLNIADFAEVIRAKKFDIGLDCEVDLTKSNTISKDICAIIDSCEIESVKTEIKGIIDSSLTIKEISELVGQLGYELSETDLGKVYEEFVKVTAKKQVIDVKELEAIVASCAMQVPSTYHLINYFVNSGNVIPATATVTLEKNGQKFTGVSTGDGPIEAAFNAIDQIVGHHYDLDDFQVHAVTKGRGSIGSSLIRLREDGKLFPGNGVSTDIVGACIRAYINALNKIVYEEK